jgi:ketosteroid isomerase-like protein
MMTVRHRAALLLAACLTATAAACGQPPGDGDAASSVARELLTAVAAGDGSRACDTLAPDTRAELEQSAGKACAEAITEESLPQQSAVKTVDVYGQWARVVMSGDTVFLATFGDGWRVVAAGCRARGERPYDCQLQGG